MKFWFDTFRSRLLLTFVTYALYMLLYIATDSQMREFYSGGNPLSVYLLDVAVTLVCIFLFVQLSIFYSRIVYSRFVFTARPYVSLMAYSLILLLLNNAMAYLLSFVTGWLFEMDNQPFLQVQHIYVYAILSTFISSVYTNAHYLYAYITAENEKKRLEILAMQAKLNALKQQIDPHFMFNNFSILSELIMEDRRLAVKFLDKLSKVYRYVIQNYDRDTVPVADELAFLDSYLYLMEMRYEGAVAVSVSSELRHAEGRIPPVCLQLLVENAVKHNSFSEEKPLIICLSTDGDNITVRNSISPLSSEVRSTGVGQRNIFERYAQLCGLKPSVSNNGEVYSVSIPIIPAGKEQAEE